VVLALLPDAPLGLGAGLRELGLRPELGLDFGRLPAHRLLPFDHLLLLLQLLAVL
jgi:hypothetical protein